jgi:5'-phosphate synthase pdxT subunit
VRKPEQLAEVRGLVIPGGESTTMALVAERWGLVRHGASRAPPRHAAQLLHASKLSRSTPQIPALREYAASGRPIWGTCAGLIFLADRAVGVRSASRSRGHA